MAVTAVVLWATSLVCMVTAVAQHRDDRSRARAAAWILPAAGSLAMIAAAWLAAAEVA
jgi:hypothetical protein